MAASIGAWHFSPLLTEFPTGILPNVGFWRATNGSWEYQIQLAWPLNWTSQQESATVETMYVLDGNALGLTAAEGVRRRRPVEFNMPDSIIVSIGYPETIPDSPYSGQRSSDFQPPVCDNCTLPAMPALSFNDDYVFKHAEFLAPLRGTEPQTSSATQPAFQISYGALEQTPTKRRTETEEEYAFRQSIIVPMRMANLSRNLYSEVKDSPRLRHIELHEYPFSDHAAVGAAALVDGLDYFLDW